MIARCLLPASKQVWLAQAGCMGRNIATAGLCYQVTTNCSIRDTSEHSFNDLGRIWRAKFAVGVGLAVPTTGLAPT